MKLHHYYNIAKAVSEASVDSETKVGAILIHKKSGAILATGFNGFIRGAPDSIIPNSRPHKNNYVVHAESNLIFHCAMHGVSMKDCFIVSTHSPCLNCSRALYQTGIKTIYFFTFREETAMINNMLDIQVRLSKTKCDGFYKLKLLPNKV